MKKIKKRFPFLVAVFMLLLGTIVSAQDEEKTKVRLKVLKNDEVTVDTTLQVASGADSDELKDLIREITGIEDLDLHLYHSGEMQSHSMIMKKYGTDSLNRVALFVSRDDELKDLEFIEEDDVAWVIKADTGDHKIMVRSGKGDEHVYAIISGDEKDLKVITRKADMVKVIHEGDLEEVDEDKAVVYDVVKKKADLDDVEEIVIKKKDGNVIIMKGDEIDKASGGHVYVKVSGDKEGAMDIFLQDNKDGTIVVKKDVKVIKKEDEEGEEVIEIVIMEKDTTKAKKEVKEKKAEREKK